MKDPRLIPEFRPPHLAVSGLTPLDEPAPPAEDFDAAFAEMENLPPKVWEGTERRAADRRQNSGLAFGGAERRSLPFGRRAADRPDFGQAGSKK